MSEREGLQAQTFEAGVISGVEEADDAPGSTLFAADYARALANAGRRDEARKLLEDLEAASCRRYVGPCGLAAHLALGDRERALALLEEALRQRAHWLTLLDLDRSPAR